MEFPRYTFAMPTALTSSKHSARLPLRISAAGGVGREDKPGESQFDHGLLLEDSKLEVQPPPLYKVCLLNDDYTPMGFVEYVLQKFFGMPEDVATRVMLSVHTQGKGVCGVFTRDIAETKVALVNEFSRHHQHPLMCVMEEA